MISFLNVWCNFFIVHAICKIPELHMAVKLSLWLLKVTFIWLGTWLNPHLMIGTDMTLLIQFKEIFYAMHVMLTGKTHILPCCCFKIPTVGLNILYTDHLTSVCTPAQSCSYRIMDVVMDAVLKIILIQRKCNIHMKHNKLCLTFSCHISVRLWMPCGLLLL